MALECPYCVPPPPLGGRQAPGGCRGPDPVPCSDTAPHVLLKMYADAADSRLSRVAAGPVTGAEEVGGGGGGGAAYGADSIAAYAAAGAGSDLV